MREVGSIGSLNVEDPSDTSCFSGRDLGGDAVKTGEGEG